jgi:hypothetical protein
MASKRKKALKQLREAVSDQARNWEAFFRLVEEHHKHHEPIPEELLRAHPSPEQEEFVADMLGAWNRPWDLWEGELTKRFDLQDKNRKRQAGIVAANGARQRKAKNDYELYRELAKTLITKNPTLRRSRHRLAQLVQTELKRQGRNAPSVKTISTALKK